MSRKEVWGVIILILLFSLGIVVANKFEDNIAGILNFGLWGMVIYVLATIVATVVAPLSTVPLIPLVTIIWGPFLTSILNIIAWGIGSIIAFIIARYFGRSIIKRFIDLSAISKYERALGEKHLFWNILFLRALIPVDILSYAIGIFTTIKFKYYVIATFIGITPFAFILSYAVEAPVYFQILVVILVLTTLYVGYKKVSSKI